MAIVEFDPELDHLSEDTIQIEAPKYETETQPDPLARTAAPPDGVDQDWTAVHPNGSKEYMKNFETKEGTSE